MCVGGGTSLFAYNLGDSGDGSYHPGAEYNHETDSDDFVGSQSFASSGGRREELVMDDEPTNRRVVPSHMPPRRILVSNKQHALHTKESKASRTQAAD